MRSFITGSRAYGVAKEDSDIDLVILVDRAAEDILREFADHETESMWTIRFGPLNIICCRSEEEFAMWKVGTKALQHRRNYEGVPQEKRAAKKLLDKLRSLLRLEDNYNR